MFRDNEPQKHLIWRALQQQLTSNGFIEKYPATTVYRFKGEFKRKTHPCFYVIILMILQKKETCEKFYGVVISSHEVIKL